MATKYIDNIVSNSISYGDSEEDIQTNNTRVIKLVNIDIDINVASVFLGDVSNGKIVKMTSKGASELSDVYAFDVTYYIDSNLNVVELVPLQSVPIISIQANVVNNYLHITGPLGAWSSLVTIV